MKLINEPHIFKGLLKDLSISKADENFLYDARNIKFTTQLEDDGAQTLMSITNVKGPLDLEMEFQGYYLGHCLLNQYLVVFATASDYDYIYRIDLSSNPPSSKTLAQTNLNFSRQHPIEAISYYENDFILKVYWTDNYNQPRYINIIEEHTTSPTSEHYDFAPSLQLNEIVNVKRNIDSTGKFASGVIQYAFSYYNKYGAESNIFYVTPLYNISPLNRGASPEEVVNNSFTLDIQGLDSNFEYLRIYSIQRTSVDSTPIVKNLIDLRVPENATSTTKITYTDTGTTGTDVDPTLLLYVGGEEILVETIELKDNTLFLGNITLKRTIIPEAIKNALKPIESESALSTSEAIEITCGTRTETLSTNKKKASNYLYTSSLPLKNTAGFKKGETYRIGLQFLHKSGKWSEPCWVYDLEAASAPNWLILNNGDEKLTIPVINVTLDLSYEIGSSTIGEILTSNDYKKIRTVVVFPKDSDKTIIALGLLCPTVYNVLDRNKDIPYAQSSWYLRPFVMLNVVDASLSIDKLYGGITLNDFSKGNYAEFRDDVPIPSSKRLNAEFPFEAYRVDLNILNLYSPELLDESNKTSIDADGIQLHLCGRVLFDANSGSADLLFSTPASLGSVKYNKVLFRLEDTEPSIAYKGFGARSLIGGPLFLDGAIEYKDNAFVANPSKGGSFMIYPWHPSGSLNNDIIRPDGSNGVLTSVLQKKRFSNLKYSFVTKYEDYYKSNGDDEDTERIFYNIPGIEIFNGDSSKLLKVNLGSGQYRNYYGNVNTALTSPEEVDVNLANNSLIYSLSLQINELSGKEEYPELLKRKEKILVKYKTSPHYVFALPWNFSSDTALRTILPTINLFNQRTGYTSFINSTAKDVIGTSATMFEVSSDFSDLLTKIVNGFRWDGVSTYYNSLYWIWQDNFPNIAHYLLTYDYFYYDNGSSITIYKKNQIGNEFSNSGSIRWEDTRELDKIDAIILIKYLDNNYLATKYKVYQNNSWTDYSVTETISFIYNVNQDDISIQTGDYTDYPFLFLGELRRATVTNRFGGNTDEALLNNLWLPCGEPVVISDELEILVQCSYGDTYFQRYDLLKTYPFSPEDENQIIEIGSFMCETHVNLDGRYDRNRGLLDNTDVNENNFNKFNSIYSLRNNYFNYRILDRIYYDENTSLNKFSNQITWTKEKLSGADIDLWTNLTLASIYNLDGSKGPIRSLNLWKDNIYCFQDKGISTILFNSRVLIPVSDGVPIEISNSFKVDGYRYLTDGTGCINKLCIKETQSGIYFIDTVGGSLYHIGNEILNVSITHNMNSAISIFDRILYDEYHLDVYLGNPFESLCFSEVLGQFTSYVDYDDLKLLESYEGEVYGIKSVGLLQNSFKLYQMFAGDYNHFFGSYRPWYIKFTSNGNSLQCAGVDKIYTNLEYRMDMYDSENVEYLNDKSFDYIRAFNEYQDSKNVPLLNLKNKPSSISKLKRMFRIWHIDIPRNKAVLGTDLYKSTGRRDRIRNPWCRFELGLYNSDDLGYVSTDPKYSAKATLHDMTVKYYI